MPYRLHLLKAADPDIYKLGYWDDRTDRTETDRLRELNRPSAEASGKTYQPFTSIETGKAFDTELEARDGREQAKVALQRSGAIFDLADPLMFQFTSGRVPYLD